MSAASKTIVACLFLSVAALTCTTACAPPAASIAAASEMPEVGNPLAVTLRRGEGDDEFIVRFTNDSPDETVRILKPLDGSEHSWLMPHYAFSVDDGHGTKFALWGRCGHFGRPYAGTKWPDDYVVEIGPGEYYEEGVWFPVHIPADGEYAVTFEYVFTPAADEHPTSDHKYPDGLWRGKAKSKPIRVKLKGHKPVVG